MSAQEVMRDEDELSDRNTMLVWYELVYRTNHGYGVCEENLLTNTGLKRPELLKIMYPLEVKGIVSARLQQIGTGGTPDRFYKLVHPRKIMLVGPVEEKAKSS